MGPWYNKIGLGKFKRIKNQFKVAQAFETAVRIFNEFTDLSLYNSLYDKEHYIGI